MGEEAKLEQSAGAAEGPRFCHNPTPGGDGVDAIAQCKDAEGTWGQSVRRRPFDMIDHHDVSLGFCWLQREAEFLLNRGSDVRLGVLKAGICILLWIPHRSGSQVIEKSYRSVSTVLSSTGRSITPPWSPKIAKLVMVPLRMLIFKPPCAPWIGIEKSSSSGFALLVLRSSGEDVDRQDLLSRVGTKLEPVGEQLAHHRFHLRVDRFSGNVGHACDIVPVGLRPTRRADDLCAMDIKRSRSGHREQPVVETLRPSMS